MKKYSRILTFFVILAFVFIFLALAQQTEEKVMCPVSGKEIKKSEAKTTYEYQGKVYYFCCEKCKEKFVKNPEKYVQKKEKAVYTCPMHSDVKSDKPGKCPKCGMNLEKKMMMEKKVMHVKKEACPIMMLSHKKDVDVKVENVENGIVIKITSNNPEIVKKIQEKISKIKACCKETEKCKKEQK